MRSPESGAAAVELALVLTVLAPMVLFALFLFELGSARLQADALARRLAFDAAAAPLSNFRRAEHGRRFEAVRDQAIRAVTPQRPAGGVAASLSVGAGDLQLTSAAVPGPAFEGLNPRGLLQARAAAHLRSVLLPVAHPRREAPFAARFTSATVRARFVLLAETWALPEGRSVRDLDGRCDSDFCREVSRLAEPVARRAWAPLAPQVEPYRRTLNFIDPPATRLASIALDGDDSGVDLKVADPPGHFPVHRHQTNVFKDRLDAGRSPVNQAYRSRGRWFLGCPDPQEEEGRCRYRRAGGP